jgi:hypothetical protein
LTRPQVEGATAQRRNMVEFILDEGIVIDMFGEKVCRTNFIISSITQCSG